MASKPHPDDARTAMLVLAAATAVINAVQDGTAARGFHGLRPAHGFAFARIAAGDATVIDVAEHLGVTKQAASKLVDHLVQTGYVRRRFDAADARRRRLELTDLGRRCTRAADAAAAEVVAGWRDQVGAAAVQALSRALAELDLHGPVRPAW